MYFLLFSWQTGFYCIFFQENTSEKEVKPGCKYNIYY